MAPNEATKCAPSTWPPRSMRLGSTAPPDAEIAEPVVALFVDRPVPAQGVRLWRFGKSFDAHLIARLGQEFPLGMPVVERRYDSSDGTCRYLLKLGDGKTVETVWMPAEGEADRATICVSSQVGCPVDCKFCLTALMGLNWESVTREMI